MGYTESELSILIVDDAEMAGINRQYRQIDHTTDVLAFPLEDGDDGSEPEPGVPRLLGDVVVCPRRAAAQARAAGTPLAFEIAMLLVHGTLHVLGYDHETDAGEMIARQGRILDDASWELLLGQV